MFLLIGFFGIFSSLFNYFLGLEESVYISIGVFLFGVIFFFLNRFTSKFEMIALNAFVIIIIIYNLYYIYNYGDEGPMVYFSFLLLYLSLYYTNKYFKIIFFIFFTLNIFVLYLLDFTISDFTSSYDSFNDMFWDHVISIFIVIISFVILIRNIIKTQIREKEIAMESRHLKSSFLSNTSHDLRAPANSILSFSELLFQEDLSKNEMKKYVNIIHNNSQQLLTLINDIFDISILESKTLKIEPKIININDLLEEVYSNTKREIEVKEKNIELNIQFGLPITQSVIYTDPVRLKQILTNLIQNAIKHTTVGAIAFGYDKKMDEEELIFFVKDTGAGIPEDKIDDIFQRYITNIDETRKVKGTGLGLHITSSLVKLLEGRIWVESVLEEGSQFYFTIPLKTNSLINRSSLYSK
jgi:signal transduction histidine kinase